MPCTVLSIGGEEEKNVPKEAKESQDQISLLYRSRSYGESSATILPISESKRNLTQVWFFFQVITSKIGAKFARLEICLQKLNNLLCLLIPVGNWYSPEPR